MRNLEGSSATSVGHPWTMDPQRDRDLQAALLGMVGHDLRQPLQVIQGTYDLLRTRVGELPERTWLDRGEQAIGKLTEQLDRLLETLRFYDYTRTLEISAVPLAPLFCGLREENGQLALSKCIDLRISTTNAFVLSNPVLLGGVLRNLVTNAIKYTDSDGRILIGCRRSGAEVRIDVFDTGIGIAAEELPRIFNAFERLDSARSDGRGIGLFVVRRALDVLGHRIEVSSTVTRGSRFSIIAPATCDPDQKAKV